MAGTHIFLHLPAKFYTIHLGHHNITDDNVRHKALSLLPTYLAVHRSNDVIFVIERGSHVVADVIIVFYHQKQRPVVDFRHSIFRFFIRAFRCAFHVKGFRISTIRPKTEYEDGASSKLALHPQHPSMQIGQ